MNPESVTQSSAIATVNLKITRDIYVRSDFYLINPPLAIGALLTHSPNKNLFYYRSPDSSLIFLAFDPRPLKAALYPFDDLLFTFFPNAARDEQREVWDAIKRIPVLFQQKWFGKKSDSRLWSEFAFEYFIPRSLYVETADSSIWVKNEIVAPDFSNDTHPLEDEDGSNISMDKTQWREKIKMIQKEINNKTVSKVVLSRTINMTDVPALNINSLYQNLLEQHNTYRYLYKMNDSIFFGASPEKLFTFEKSAVETEALAGTIQRGSSEEEDEALRSELLNLKKEREEHQIVVTHLLDVLGRFAKEVSAPADPSIRQLKTIQHLWSSVRAKNIHHRLIPQMIDELFPTPATCGNPKLEAMRIIENIEEHTRGLYAGVIGWYC